MNKCMHAIHQSHIIFVLLPFVVTLSATATCSFQVNSSRSLCLLPVLRTNTNNNIKSNKIRGINMSLGSNNSNENSWSMKDDNDVQTVKSKLHVWPLDEYNVKLLNEVHPKHWSNDKRKKQKAMDDNDNLEENVQSYDFIALGAGAGGLVTSRQVRLWIVVPLSYHS